MDITKIFTHSQEPIKETETMLSLKQGWWGLAQAIGYTCDGWWAAMTDGYCGAKRLATAGGRHPPKRGSVIVPNLCCSFTVISWRGIWSQGLVLFCFFKGISPLAPGGRGSETPLHCCCWKCEVHEENNLIKGIWRFRSASLLFFFLNPKYRRIILWNKSAGWSRSTPCSKKLEYNKALHRAISWWSCWTSKTKDFFRHPGSNILSPK